MLSPINTGGFQVSEMPKFTAPDPQLLAKYSPLPYLQGAQVAAGIGKAYQAMQEQPSETAANIAEHQLKANELGPQGLGGLNPLEAFSVQAQGEKPLDTHEENTLDPDTGKVTKITRSFVHGADTSNPANAISTSSSVDQQPKVFQTGGLNVTPEGTGVTTSFFMPRDPSKAALSLDKTTGLWTPNDNAVAMKSDYVFQKNLMGRGAQANAQQGAVLMDLLGKTDQTTPQGKAAAEYYMKAIKDLQDGNEADADKNAALAKKAIADADKAEGANSTAKEIANIKETGANAREASKEAGANAREAAKEASRTADLIKKNAATWSLAELSSGYRNSASMWKDIATAPDGEAKDAAMERVQQLDRMIKTREALGDKANSDKASNTIPQGSPAGQAPTDAQIQEVLDHPEAKQSFIATFGQAMYDRALAKSQSFMQSQPGGAMPNLSISAIPQVQQ